MGMVHLTKFLPRQTRGIKPLKRGNVLNSLPKTDSGNFIQRFIAVSARLLLKILLRLRGNLDHEEVYILLD